MTTGPKATLLLPAWLQALANGLNPLARQQAAVTRTKSPSSGTVCFFLRVSTPFGPILSMLLTKLPSGQAGHPFPTSQLPWASLHLHCAKHGLQLIRWPAFVPFPGETTTAQEKNKSQGIKNLTRPQIKRLHEAFLWKDPELRPAFVRAADAKQVCKPHDACKCSPCSLTHFQSSARCHPHFPSQSTRSIRKRHPRPLHVIRRTHPGLLFRRIWT